jgi:eukaryotic-like serine/threonine-protein kinase
MKFTYNSGQRVLDGYTLKRGIGRGGFGEVYYAVSDGGKDVALKLVRGHNLDVELRGMAQCLNLKHPNLLTLYDMRTDPQGDHWVVMEYIAGESLNAVLNRHPQGLPVELARQWFVALCKAVGYLHDHGIVHRDLKPGNIFLENGVVKVGDYGLCKFMSSSQQSAQTQSVGTVHYMAPEISTGNYNKQIDIYAAGVVLYEMLSGHVPFEGESAGEILMKHLTAPPDLTKIPAAFAPVIGKALAKNPAQRYASMLDMAKAIEPAVGASVPPPVSARPAPKAAPPRRTATPAQPIPSVIPVVSVRGQTAELCGSLALAALLAGLCAIVWARIGEVGELSNIGPSFFLTVAVCWAVLIPAKFWSGRPGDSGIRRGLMMVIGLMLGAGALWLEGWEPAHTRAWYAAGQPSSLPAAAGYLSYFGLAFFALRWWKMADRRRMHRFSFAPLIAAGFWGIALGAIGPWSWPDTLHGILALVLAAGIVQLVSPWEPLPRSVVKPVRLRYV